MTNNRDSSKRLYIIRGIFGTGKSTVGHAMHQGFIQQGLTSIVIDANELVDAANDGKAHGDRFASLISWAYKQCVDDTEEAMRLGVGCILVTNAYAQLTWTKSYQTLAKQYGYSVSIITCHTFHGNPRNINMDTLIRMKEEMVYPTTILPKNND